MLRPIAVEYTSRYSTGKPSRENAPAVAEPPVTDTNAGSVRSAPTTAVTRRNNMLRTPGRAASTGSLLPIRCSIHPFTCPALNQGTARGVVTPDWGIAAMSPRRYQHGPRQLTDR